MKLNKKLLTAALAGALIVTAVPAGTFAASTEKEEQNYRPEEAMARLQEHLDAIKVLNLQRQELVSAAFNGQANQHDLRGEIERSQAVTAQAKKAKEQADAALEQAIANKSAAYAAKDAAFKKLQAANEAFTKANNNKEKELAAAKDAKNLAEKQAADKYQVTMESINTKYNDEVSKVAKAEVKVKGAKTSYEEALKLNEKDSSDVVAKKNAWEDAELELAKAQKNLKVAENNRDAAVKAAKDLLAQENKVAQSNYDAELRRIDKQYNYNGLYGDKLVAELNRLRREQLNAKTAYADSITNYERAVAAEEAAKQAALKATEAYSKASEISLKKVSELKEIEVKLQERYVRVAALLKDQGMTINALAGKLAEDNIKELQQVAKLTGSQQIEYIAKLKKEIAELEAKYNKVKEEVNTTKGLVTYKFAVKDTEGKGVEGLTLKLTSVDDTNKSFTASSDKDGNIFFKSILEGKYTVTVVRVPKGYDVYQGGKKIDSVKALFRAESEVKAENNAEEATAKKEEKSANKKIELPLTVDVGEQKESTDKKENKDEKVIDGGTIVVEKQKDKKDNKKEEKKNNKKLTKPASPAKPNKKKLPKAGAAAEAATIAAAAMATMGGAYLSLKKRK